MRARFPCRPQCSSAHPVVALASLARRYAPNKFEAYGEEEIEAVAECLRDGFLAPGPRTEEFERQTAALFDKDLGLMVNSGSSANLIALNAFGFKPGDEVVTAACTFSTVIAPLVQLGVKPIFVDVDFTYVPDVDVIMKAVTPRTVLIWLPNLVGSKPDWEALRKRTSLPLWEDSCDTITKTKVTDVSMTSFYASHMITAGGGGGMIMANDKSFIDKCRMYRDWGRIGNNSEDLVERFGSSVDGIPYDGKFLYGVIGYNMKSTEMNAAFGLVQLQKLERFRAIRRANFDRFLSNMKVRLSHPLDPSRPLSRLPSRPLSPSSAPPLPPAGHAVRAADGARPLRLARLPHAPPEAAGAAHVPRVEQHPDARHLRGQHHAPPRLPRAARHRRVPDGRPHHGRGLPPRLPPRHHLCPDRPRLRAAQAVCKGQPGRAAQEDEVGAQPPKRTKKSAPAKNKAGGAGIRDREDGRGWVYVWPSTRGRSVRQERRECRICEGMPHGPGLEVYTGGNARADLPCVREHRFEVPTGLRAHARLSDVWCIGQVQELTELIHQRTTRTQLHSGQNSGRSDQSSDPDSLSAVTTAGGTSLQRRSDVLRFG